MRKSKWPIILCAILLMGSVIFNIVTIRKTVRYENDMLAAISNRMMLLYSNSYDDDREEFGSNVDVLGEMLSLYKGNVDIYRLSCVHIIYETLIKCYESFGETPQTDAVYEELRGYLYDFSSDRKTFKERIEGLNERATSLSGSPFKTEKWPNFDYLYDYATGQLYDELAEEYENQPGVH